MFHISSLMSFLICGVKSRSGHPEAGGRPSGRFWGNPGGRRRSQPFKLLYKNPIENKDPRSIFGTCSAFVLVRSHLFIQK